MDEPLARPRMGGSRIRQLLDASSSRLAGWTQETVPNHRTAASSGRSGGFIVSPLPVRRQYSAVHFCPVSRRRRPPRLARSGLPWLPTGIRPSAVEPPSTCAGVRGLLSGPLAVGLHAGAMEEGRPEPWQGWFDSGSGRKVTKIAAVKRFERPSRAAEGISHGLRTCQAF